VVHYNSAPLPRWSGDSHRRRYADCFERMLVLFLLLADLMERESKLMQRTLVLLKPDCVQRRLMGRIISRFEDKGYNLIAMKMMRITPELARQHYAEHVEKAWYPTLEGFITGGPVLAAVVEGIDAVDVVRSMLGPTNGRDASAGTIRGDFGCSRQMNLVHASDGLEAAAREIDLYFDKREICEYDPTISSWLKAVDE